MVSNDSFLSSFFGKAFVATLVSLVASVITLALDWSVLATVSILVFLVAAVVCVIAFIIRIGKSVVSSLRAEVAEPAHFDKKEFDRRTDELLVKSGPLQLEQMLDWEMKQIEVAMPQGKRPLIGVGAPGEGWRYGTVAILVVVDAEGMTVQGIERQDDNMLFSGGTNYESGKTLAESIIAPISTKDLRALGLVEQLQSIAQASTPREVKRAASASSNIAYSLLGAVGGYVASSVIRGLRQDTSTGRVSSSCIYCGMELYGSSCPKSPHGRHEHDGDEAHCKFCGWENYGHSCAHGPNGVHEHGSGRKCRFCGVEAYGSGCLYNPSGVHVH